MNDIDMTTECIIQKTYVITKLQVRDAVQCLFMCCSICFVSMCFVSICLSCPPIHLCLHSSALSHCFTASLFQNSRIGILKDPQALVQTYLSQASKETNEQPSEWTVAT